MLTENFGIYEILILAALAYATYEAFTSKDKSNKTMTLAGCLIGIPGVLLLNSAGGSDDTFGADATTAPSGLVAANFSGTEMLYVAAIGYGAYLLYSAGKTTAAIAAAVACALLLWNANDSTENF